MAIYYAKPTATGTGDGSSWANADDLTGALASAGSTDEVRATAGAYLSPPYTVPDGVTMRGSFDPTSPESDPADRDLAANESLIDAGGASRYLGELNGATVIVDGFSFDDGESAVAPGHWVRISNGVAYDVTLRNCRFYDTATDGPLTGACFYTDDPGAAIRLENCLCLPNSTSLFQARGGGLIRLNGVTAFGEDNGTFDEFGGALDAGSVVDIDNSILWTAEVSAEYLYAYIGGTATCNYSIITGGFAGTGNVDSDPLFVDEANGDFSLQSGSPAIDAANSGTAPSEDILLVTRDASPDMGAFEFVSSGQTVSPGAIASGSAASAPTASPGAVTVTPGQVASGSAVSAPTVASGATVAPGAVAATSAALAPSASAGPVTVTPAAVAAISVLHAPTLALGAVAIDPAAIASGSALLAPQADAGAVTLQPAQVGSTASLLALTAVPGAVVVQPGAVASSAALLALTVVPGAGAVSPAQIGSTAAAFAVVAAPGAVAVLPGQIGSAAQVFAPSDVIAGAFILPALVGPGSVLYAPTAVPAPVTVQPSAIASTLVALTPQVAVGVQSIDAPAIASTLALLAPQVVVGGAVVSPGQIAAASAALSPQVAPGGVSVQPAAIAAASAVYAPGLGVLLPVGAIGSGAQVFALVDVQVGAAVIQPAVIVGGVIYALAVQGGQAPAGPAIFVDPRVSPIFVDPRAPAIFVRPDK